MDVHVVLKISDSYPYLTLNEFNLYCDDPNLSATDGLEWVVNTVLRWFKHEIRNKINGRANSGVRTVLEMALKNFNDKIQSGEI